MEGSSSITLPLIRSHDAVMQRLKLIDENEEYIRR